MVVSILMRSLLSYWGESSKLRVSTDACHIKVFFSKNCSESWESAALKLFLSSPKAWLSASMNSQNNWQDSNEDIFFSDALVEQSCAFARGRK